MVLAVLGHSVKTKGTHRAPKEPSAVNMSELFDTFEDTGLTLSWDHQVASGIFSLENTLGVLSMDETEWSWETA